MATKNYFVGPEDGWVKVVTGASPAASVRISAMPHTHPFFVFGDPSATPSLLTTTGVLVCHHPFKITNGVAGTSDAFWVRIKNPVTGSNKNDGKLRIDVYTDGGTLA